MRAPIFSIVIPVFNEATGLDALCERLTLMMASLDGDTEVVFVDDGSRDESVAIIKKHIANDARFGLVCLARNFGHQVAITAGMAHAKGKAVIIMDADLQDPPEVVQQLIAEWRHGYDVVYAVRAARLGESRFKKLTASWFYRLLGAMSDVEIPVDAGDFRLIDRRVLEAYQGLREHSRFVRGLFAWLGFRQKGVTYVRAGRYAGESKYNLRSMLRLAITALVGFSQVPLRLPLYAAGLWALLTLPVVACGVAGWLPLAETIMLLAILVVATSQSLLLGVVCVYLGKIHDEARGRPLYVVQDRYGVTATEAPGTAEPVVGDNATGRTWVA